MKGDSSFAIDEDSSLNMFHLTKKHSEERSFSLIFFTKNHEHIAFFQFNVVLDIKLKFSSWMCADCPLFNNNLTNRNVSFYESGSDLIRFTEEFLEFGQTDKPIMERYRNGSESFHRIVANT